MKRRDFCKLMAASAIATAGLNASRSAEAGTIAGGFDQLNESYPQFFGTPAADRTFYAL